MTRKVRPYNQYMPAKNTLRNFRPDSFYHCYQRGNNTQAIYKDDQDYHVFISYLKKYLSPQDPNTLSQIKNYYPDISLHAYCLLPNHYHLLIHQQTQAPSLL